MGWEWLGFTITGLTAIANFAYTYRTGHRQREMQLIVSSRQLVHSRLEAVYVEVLTELQRAWARNEFRAQVVRSDELVSSSVDRGVELRSRLKLYGRSDVHAEYAKVVSLYGRANDAYKRWRAQWQAEQGFPGAHDYLAEWPPTDEEKATSLPEQHARAEQMIEDADARKNALEERLSRELLMLADHEVSPVGRRWRRRANRREAA